MVARWRHEHSHSRGPNKHEYIKKSIRINLGRRRPFHPVYFFLRSNLRLMIVVL